MYTKPPPVATDSSNSQEQEGKDIEYWSDYLCSDLHPNTIFECKDYKFAETFRRFSDGLNFLKDHEQVTIYNNIS